MCDSLSMHAPSISADESFAPKQVMLAVPGSQLSYETSAAIAQTNARGHDLTVENSGHGWDDMNELWVRGLNAARRGEITHFAMLHTDVAPAAGWLDVLLGDLDTYRADFVSAVVPIKDPRGLTSCGVGDLADPWSAHRRFTIRELAKFPETFGLGDACVSLAAGQTVWLPTSHYLLHNTGCWAADLRNKTWLTTEGAVPELVASFKFNIRSRVLASGRILHERESEDWYFSRRMAELGLKTLVTRKVELIHVGRAFYPNSSAWGAWEHDEETRSRWEPAARRATA